MLAIEMEPGGTVEFDESGELGGCGVITKIDVDKDTPTITLAFDDGSVFELYHEQYCCEDVTLDQMDIDDLMQAVGDGPATLVFRVTRSNGGESFTHTFVDVATKTHTATVAFKGTSNGYYSETVSIRRCV